VAGKEATMSTIIPLKEKALPAACLVFKHSTTCPISASAAQEVRAMATDLPIYWINVREQRELSNWVAAAYNVAHESPQLILIEGGATKKAWSHYEVKRTVVSP
jgi:bacillithiol system protein YtxJ